MDKVIKILICMAAGFTFWMPSIIIHALRNYHFGESKYDIVSITILPVVAAIIAFIIFLRKMSGELSRGATAMAMLLSIWMLGPLCMLISASFSGGGFVQSETSYLSVVGIVACFPFTYIMSAYDGTLGAVGLVTVWLLVEGVVSLTRNLIHARHNRVV